MTTELSPDPITLVTVAGYDDWYGLYVDGILVDEGHDISVGTLAAHLKGQAFMLQVLDEWEVGVGISERWGCRMPFALTEILELFGS